MKLSYLILGLVLLGFISGKAQQIPLEGQVSIHNSKYKTDTTKFVKNAEVSAENTMPNNTDALGQFQLEFVGLENGKAVKLMVEKAGMEVVNWRDLNEVVVGRKDPLSIYLAQEGEVDQARLEFFNIGVMTLRARYDSIIKLLYDSLEISNATITKLEIQFGVEIQSRHQAEELLNARIDELERRLPEFALQLASENLDFASEIFIEAYEFFKKGEIEKAINMLDNAKILTLFKNEREAIEKADELTSQALQLDRSGKTQFKQGLSVLELNARMLYLTFDYERIIDLYVEIAQLYDGTDRYGLDLARLYDQLAIALQYNGKPRDALTWHIKAMKIRQNELSSDHPELANSYDHISVTYGQLGQYESSLEFQQKALSILEKADGTYKLQLATSYSNASNTYEHLGNYEQAVEYQKKAIDIREALLDSNYYDLATSYNNMASTYLKMGLFNEALKFNLKSVAICENTLDKNDPFLASVYNNLAATYQNLGQYEESLQLNLKSISIKEQVLRPMHPLLGISYSNVAQIYVEMGQYDKALDYNMKALKNTKGAYGPKHPLLATAYESIVYTQIYLGKLDKASEFHLKAIEILENIHKPNHPSLGDAYNYSAGIYTKLGNYPRALYFQKKAIEIYNDAFGPTNAKLAVPIGAQSLIYYKWRKYRKSLKFANQSTDIYKEHFAVDHPHRIGSYNNTGLVFTKTRKYKKAYEAFSKFENLSSRKELANRNWALYYARKNEKEKAISHLKKAIDLGYNNLNWLKTDDVMNRLRNEPEFIAIVDALEAKIETSGNK